MNEQEFIRRMKIQGVKLIDQQLKIEYQRYLKNPESFGELAKKMSDLFLEGLAGKAGPGAGAAKAAAKPITGQAAIKQRYMQDETIEPKPKITLPTINKAQRINTVLGFGDAASFPQELETARREADARAKAEKQAKTKQGYMRDDAITPNGSAEYDTFLDGLGQKTGDFTADGGRTSGGREAKEPETNNDPLKVAPVIQNGQNTKQDQAKPSESLYPEAKAATGDPWTDFWNEASRGIQIAGKQSELNSRYDASAMSLPVNVVKEGAAAMQSAAYGTPYQWGITFDLEQGLVSDKSYSELYKSNIKESVKRGYDPFMVFGASQEDALGTALVRCFCICGRMTNADDVMDMLIVDRYTNIYLHIATRKGSEKLKK